MDRAALVSAGVLGATGVALGAFGAHGLPNYLEAAGYDTAEVAKRIETLVTGTRYQVYGALALLTIGLAGQEPAFRWAVRLLTCGVVVFSGLLYALAVVDGFRWLGAIVPIGGLAMIGGWIAIGWVGWRTRQTAADDRDELAAEVVRLEEVITHQQRVVQALDEAVTATRDAADQTTRRSLSVEQTVKRLAEYQQGAEDLPDERPPHY